MPCRLRSERRRAGLPLLDLTESNPTAAGIQYPSELHAALADECVLRYEPSAMGLASAREAVANYYSGRVDACRILLTASTSEAYSYLFKLLCNPGDEVLIPQPSYPLFEMLAQLECVRVVSYPLRYHDGWFIDVPALREAISQRTRAIIWVNPNNPTGSYITREEYHAIASLCLEHGLALISDEVFADYALAPEDKSMATLSSEGECLCFSLSGLSKICGLPQMKLGWIVASGPGSPDGAAAPGVDCRHILICGHTRAMRRARVAWGPSFYTSSDQRSCIGQPGLSEFRGDGYSIPGAAC